MRRIRVLHVLETIGSGGVEQRRLLLAEMLGTDAFEQQVICSRGVGALPARFEEAGCRVHEVGQLKRIYDPKPYLSALPIIRAFEPDIVHGAVFEGVAIASIMGRVCGVPIVLGEETDDPGHRSRSASLLFRLLAGSTTKMVAVSRAVERYLVDSLGLPEGHVATIRNGVRRPRPPSKAELQHLQRALGFGVEDFVLGFVGRLLDRHKRVSDLLHAFARLRVKLSGSLKLVIVGGGHDEDALRWLAVRLGVDGDVAFVGYQPDTSPYLHLMDVFVLPSAHEAFGLVLVEAMYAGVPVVATNVGGIPDVVVDGQTGLLVAPFRPDEIGGAISKLHADQDLRTRMGREGARRAESEFSAERYVEDVRQLYSTMLARTGSAACTAARDGDNP